MVKFSYNKLWKMLIDKGMNKKDLKELTGISGASMAKLGKGESLTTNVLLKICDKLECDISDIAEVIRIENETKTKSDK